MATFWATFCASGDRGLTGDAMPAMKGRNARGLTVLTTSGTAGLVQSGGADFMAPNTGVVAFLCDGPIWVHVGSNPTAAVGTAFYFAADERQYLTLENGDKISVIDG